MKSVSTLQIHEITNHKLQKTKLFCSVLHALLNVIFLHQEKEKYFTQAFVTQAFICLRIFISFVLIPHNSQIWPS